MSEVIKPVITLVTAPERAPIYEPMKAPEIERYVRVFEHQQDIIGTPQQLVEYPLPVIQKPL